ncbi:hypothetical protein ACMFMG_008603 [Clarireedia jacksonii]
MPLMDLSINNAASLASKPADSVEAATVMQDAPLRRNLAPTLLSPHKDMVTIHVINASGRTLDHVHKSFLCYASPCFDAAFNGAFIEGQTQSMNLETSEQAFGVVKL